MRFDSSKAWNEAAQSVAANRDVLLALAGVFMVLPLFALAVFVPQPEPPAGSSAEALLELLGAYYRQTWPAYLAAALVNMVGTLAMLALLTDPSRPTVGQTIRLGTVATPSVIAAQLMMGMGLALAAMVPVAAVSALGVPALAVVAVAAALAVAVWVWIRCALVMPAVMVDGLKNPFAALQRSWRLTQGNAGRLLAFLVLVGVAFLISIFLAQMVIGLVLSLALPGEAAAVGTALVASVLQAVMSVYFVAVIAASHRQLSAPEAQLQAREFE
jgi:Membrane domain of glycerophosphoryl diester phosphodiesterase